jgi:hypothetical protein
VTVTVLAETKRGMQMAKMEAMRLGPKRRKIRKAVTEICGAALGMSGEEYELIGDLRYFVNQFACEPSEERLRRVQRVCDHLEVLSKLRGCDAPSPRTPPLEGE